MWRLWKRVLIAEIMCGLALERSMRGRIMKPRPLPLGRRPISGGQGAPSLGTPPKGFALSELVLVLAICGLVVGILAVAGLVAIDQPSDSEQQAAQNARRGSKVICSREVPLGNGFVCTAQLLEHMGAGPHHPPEYLSRVHIAHRSSSESEAFLLEISTCDQPSRETPSTWTWRTRKLMSSDAADALQYVQLQAAQDSFRLTKLEPKTDAAPFYAADTLRVQYLEEPLFLFVPPHLHETGVLVLSSECDAQDLGAIDDFPVERLAASIRSAMRNDHWEPGDLHALLRRYDAGNRRLSEDEERAIARLLVRRVLESLPQEEPGISNLM